MYIHRIIIKDVRSIQDLDLTFWNDWTQEPLQNVLLTGPNGSGKTTILETIAYLWEKLRFWVVTNRLDEFMKLAIAVPNSGYIGLAAIEIREFLSKPLWIVVAKDKIYADFIQPFLSSDNVILGRYDMEMHPISGNLPSTEEFQQLSGQLLGLQLGVNDAKPLPNLLFLDMRNRFITPPDIETLYKVEPEPLYRWLVNYNALSNGASSLEHQIRNLKVRDPQWFRETIALINPMFHEKELTDFDNNLKLTVKTNRDSHYLENLSSGEQAFIILEFMVSRWLMNGGVVLIDEPDLYLHVSLQRQLMYALKNIVAEKKGQIIVTSHSPELWDEFNELERRRLGSAVYEPA